MSESDPDSPAPRPRKEHPTLVSFCLYLLVAPGSLVADLSVFTLLTEWVDLDAVIAHVISRPVGGLVCFYLNKFVTFQNKGDASEGQQMMRFWVVFGSSYLLSTGLLGIFVHLLHWNELAAKLTSEAICVLFNYVSLRFWTFR